MTDDELSAERVMLALLPEGEARWTAEKTLVRRLMRTDLVRAAELALLWWSAKPHHPYRREFLPLVQRLREAGQTSLALRCLDQLDEPFARDTELLDWSVELAIRRLPDDDCLLGEVVRRIQPRLLSTLPDRRYTQALTVIIPPLCDTPNIARLSAGLLLLGRIEQTGARNLRPVLEALLTAAKTLPTDETLRVLRQVPSCAPSGAVRSWLLCYRRILATLPESLGRAHAEQHLRHWRFTLAMRDAEQHFREHYTFTTMQWHRLERLVHWATTANQPEAKRVRLWLDAVLGRARKYDWHQRHRAHLDMLRARLR